MPWYNGHLVTMVFMLASVAMVHGIIEASRLENSDSFDANFTAAPGNLISQKLPNLSTFTGCWWMKQTVPVFGVFSHPILSISTLDATNALVFVSLGGSEDNAGVLLEYKTRNSGLIRFNTKDNRWHHVCIAFNTGTREMTAYTDGESLKSAIIQTGPKEMVLEGGCLVVGWRQSSYCTVPVKPSFDQAYTGMLSMLNIWGRLLGAAEVRDVYRGCTGYHGDVFSWDWPAIKGDFHKTNITTPTSACHSQYSSAIFVSYQGEVLHGHTIKAFQAQDVFSCTQACMQDNKCKSINLLRRSNDYICELNSKHVESKGSFVSAQEGEYYYKSKFWNG
ncbi:neuronal pentraxin-2 [Nematostella vectensis]|nr:neuronal pentraxin-2 [Nematostella vectensis]